MGQRGRGGDQLPNGTGGQLRPGVRCGARSLRLITWDFLEKNVYWTVFMLTLIIVSAFVDVVETEVRVMQMTAEERARVELGLGVWEIAIHAVFALELILRASTTHTQRTASPSNAAGSPLRRVRCVCGPTGTTPTRTVTSRRTRRCS